tara:strand:+ start:4774 stop:5100 length:327 start_codon:yes stop_codon:yes gene_type:complete
MGWYKRAQQQQYNGYKMVAWDGQRAYSLYDQNQTIDISIGSTTQMEGQGVFLGTTREFCMNYYSGLTDDQDMLLTYTYNAEDIIEGDPNHPNSEIRVRQARLTNYELV